MPTADEVIVEFEAKVGRYEADLKRSAATFERVTGAQQRQMQALERQISASTGKIGSAFRALAGVFSAQQVIGLSDSYTRLQNSLKVAGLEGENLLKVQGQLLDLGGKYGVSINTLADLYGNLSQTGKELGASQAQILTINKAVAQSLIVTGKSSAEAQGAVLGLVQAFGNGKLQAEEWAQINEGGLRPLLEAAAASDKYGGSIQKLRKAVYDGKVSSQEFFQALLAGAGIIEAKAANATLTLEGAFTSLNNRLIEYVGSASSAGGASGALASGIQALGDNLDTISKALAIIATVIGVRYVTASVAAGVSTIALASANGRAALTAEALASSTYRANAALLGEATAARLAAASVTGLAVAQGTAARAGGALLAVVGGPVGAAVLALGAGIAYLASKTLGTAEATEVYSKAERQASITTERAADAAEKLASAHGKARVEALARARAEAEVVKQNLASARSSVVAAQAELARARTRAESVQLAPSNPLAVGAGAMGADMGAAFGSTAVTQADLRVAEANAKAAKATAARLQKSLEGITAVINAAEVPAVKAAADDDKKKAGSKKAGADGPDAQAADRELARLRVEELQARLELTTDAEKRAELQSKILAEERIQREAEIKANKDLSAAQKKLALASIERTYGGGSADPNDIVASAGYLQRGIA